MIVWSALAVGAYLSGSIPFAWILGRVRGVDIRTAGSRNPGATNLGRLCGKPWGYAAFVLDAAKGVAPVLVARFATVEAFEDEGVRALATVVAAALAVVGHVTSPFLGFKGGKGVATAAGGLAAACPIPTAVVVAFWVLAFAVTRTIGVASIVAGLAALVTGGLVLVPGVELGETTHPHGVLLVVLGVVVLLRHRENWQRYRAARRAVASESVTQKTGAEDS